jgi:hypothetical protein
MEYEAYLQAADGHRHLRRKTTSRLRNLPRSETLPWTHCHRLPHHLENFPGAYSLSQTNRQRKTMTMTNHPGEFPGALALSLRRDGAVLPPHCVRCASRGSHPAWFATLFAIFASREPQAASHGSSHSRSQRWRAAGVLQPARYLASCSPHLASCPPFLASCA